MNRCREAAKKVAPKKTCKTPVAAFLTHFHYCEQYAAEWGNDQIVQTLGANNPDVDNIENFLSEPEYTQLHLRLRKSEKKLFDVFQGILYHRDKQVFLKQSRRIYLPGPLIWNCPPGSCVNSFASRKIDFVHFAVVDAPRIPAVYSDELLKYKAVTEGD